MFYEFYRRTKNLRPADKFSNIHGGKFVNDHLVYVALELVKIKNDTCIPTFSQSFFTLFATAGGETLNNDSAIRK